MAYNTLEDLFDDLRKMFHVAETVYNPETGRVAIPMSVDAGEVNYLVAFFTPLDGKWRVTRRATPLNNPAEWYTTKGVTEVSLKGMAEKHYVETE